MHSVLISADLLFFVWYEYLHIVSRILILNWIWREKHSTLYVKAQFRPNWAINQVHISYFFCPRNWRPIPSSLQGEIAVLVRVEPPPCENCGASNYSWILSEVRQCHI